VVVSSTPYGTDGFFAELFQRASSGELEDALAQHATTAEADPTVGSGFMEQERARDPESFRADYLAEFLGSGGAYLDPARIEEAVAERGELAPEQARTWIAGLDPAFSSDPFGLAMVGRALDGSGRLVLALAQSWKPSRRKPDSFEERRQLEDVVLAEVAEVCHRYGARVVTDQYAAAAIVDRLRRVGLAVEAIALGAGTKTQAFAELRARLYTGQLELYEHPSLIAELRRLRQRHTAGAASVVNPRVGGSHGDMAQALALAVYEHDRYGITRGNGWKAGEPRQPMIASEATLARVFGQHTDRRARRWYDQDEGLIGRVF
jgi:phage terminase large subunit-like protein